ncbi:universal stress protein phos34 [Quercus suber]|uniref:Universal stress protein phos34 n=1 Tax=Quercus suber TaxID=58331 RepID=A0AAW0KNF8_QUESU
MHHQHQHQHQHQDSSLESDPQLPAIRIHHPASPRHHSSGVGATPTPTAGARRKIGVAVDLSDESAYAVRWAVHHYLRPGDAVILLHDAVAEAVLAVKEGEEDDEAVIKTVPIEAVHEKDSMKASDSTGIS